MISKIYVLPDLRTPNVNEQTGIQNAFTESTTKSEKNERRKESIRLACICPSVVCPFEAPPFNSTVSESGAQEGFAAEPLGCVKINTTSIRLISLCTRN